MNLVNTEHSLDIDPIIRVALIGSECVMRAGLRMLIDSQPGLQTVGEIACGGDPAALWTATQPDVALVDLDGPESLECISALRALPCSPRIIVLTGMPESEPCERAIERGVLGVVSKQQAPEILFTAIEKVHAGEAWLNRTKIAGVLGTLRAARSRRAFGKSTALLPRERQVIKLVGQGLRNDEIAATIFVSEATVRNCLGSIFKKLGVADRAHLMLYAMQDSSLCARASSQAPRRDVLRLATLGGRALEGCPQP